MRLPSVADRHLWIGFNSKECFRIARLNPAQMESMGTKDREAGKGSIEGHRLEVSDGWNSARFLRRLVNPSGYADVDRSSPLSRLWGFFALWADGLLRYSCGCL